MRSILILPLVARCLETIDVCIWRMCVFIYLLILIIPCAAVVECLLNKFYLWKSIIWIVLHIPHISRSYKGVLYIMEYLISFSKK